MLARSCDKRALPCFLAGSGQRPGAPSEARFSIGVDAAHRAFLILGEPHLLSILVKAQDLDPDPYYCVHHYFGEAGADSEILFIGRAEVERTMVHKKGFIPVGTNGLVVPNHVGGSDDAGTGTSRFRKGGISRLQVFNVSALTSPARAKRCSRKPISRLCRNRRGADMWHGRNRSSLCAVLFLFTVYLPLNDWGHTFSPSHDPHSLVPP